MEWTPFKIDDPCTWPRKGFGEDVPVMMSVKRITGKWAITIQGYWDPERRFFHMLHTSEPLDDGWECVAWAPVPVAYQPAGQDEE